MREYLISEKYLMAIYRMPNGGGYMGKFILKDHIVGEASFIENGEKEKKNSIEINVGGGVLIPIDEPKKAVVKLTFHLGKEEERVHLLLKTVSVFEVVEEERTSITEEEVKRECLPIALAQLRKTVKKVLEAYGRSGIDLPPFEEENIFD